MVSLHCALDEKTKHLINKERLAIMKSDAVLVNAARGPVIDEVALVEHLKANPNFRCESRCACMWRRYTSVGATRSGGHLAWTRSRGAFRTCMLAHVCPHSHPPVAMPLAQGGAGRVRG